MVKKRNNKVRFMKFVLSAVLAITTCLTIPVTSRAEETSARPTSQTTSPTEQYEVAPTLPATANTASTETSYMQQIETNTSYTGALSGEKAKNRYQFTMDKDGYFTINFSKVNPTEYVGDGWNITLYDTAGNKCISEEGIKSNYTSAKLDFKKGSQFYLQIESRFDFSEPKGKTYKIEIQSVQDTLWEQESNDSINDATVLTNDVAKSGTLWNRLDEDYYSYTVEKQGYFVIDLIREDPTLDIDAGYDLLIFDANGEELDRYTRITTNYTSNKYNFMVGDKLYFKIKNRIEQFEYAVGAVYSLKITNVEDASWEKENRADDGSSWADRIAANNVLSDTPIRGSLWTAKDRDLYKYTMPGAGTLTVNFNVNNDSSRLGQGYNVAFLDGNGKEIKVYSRINANQSLSQDMAAGDCYIKVYSNNDLLSDTVFNEYTISATYTPSQKKEDNKDDKEITDAQLQKTVPAVGTVKAEKKKGGKRSVTIKWKKVTGANGYKVYKSTRKNKGFKCVKTIKNGATVSWKDSKVKKGKTYYYKMRAYKKSGKKTVYSKYSSIKKIKVK